MKTYGAGLLVSCDPGLRHTGIGVFKDAVLVHAALYKNPVRKARGPEEWWGLAEYVAKELERVRCAHAGLLRWVPPINLFVVEVPQVYGFGKKRVDPDDLIQLAGVGGAVGAVLRPKAAVGYYPREWKKQVPKNVMCSRIESRLSPGELSVIEKCAPSLMNNVWDGIGLGLFELGRLIQ